MTTTACSSCSSDEGAELRLTGLQDYITCHTNKLDHAGVTDYSDRGDFFTQNDDKEEDGWGGCYKVSKVLAHIGIVIPFSSISERSEG